MATFGAKRPCFAPFAETETSAAMPKYHNGVEIGALVNANRAVTLTNGEVWGDNIKQEQMNEFASAQIPIETVDIEDKAKKTVYGLEETEDGELGYGANDEPPYGGLTYYKNLLRKGKKLFRGFFYPKAQAAVGNDNAATKGSSITFQTDTTTFNISAPLCPKGKWCYERTFETEEEVIAWQDKKLGMTETPAPEG